MNDNNSHHDDLFSLKHDGNRREVESQWRPINPVSIYNKNDGYPKMKEKIHTFLHKKI